jgi:hypothetical protein
MESFNVIQLFLELSTIIIILVLPIIVLYTHAQILKTTILIVDIHS